MRTVHLKVVLVQLGKLEIHLEYLNRVGYIRGFQNRRLTETIQFLGRPRKVVLGLPTEGKNSQFCKRVGQSCDSVRFLP